MGVGGRVGVMVVVGVVFSPFGDVEAVLAVAVEKLLSPPDSDSS